jgi:ethanolamine utilization microcompartment shell protein EutS
MTGEFLSRNDVERILAERASRDEEFRAELLANPKEVIAREFGIGEMPEDLAIHVIQETPNEIYIVLPSDPQLEGALRQIRLRLLWGYP